MNDMAQDCPTIYSDLCTETQQLIKAKHMIAPIFIEQFNVPEWVTAMIYTYEPDTNNVYSSAIIQWKDSHRRKFEYYGQKIDFQSVSPQPNF